MKTLFLLALLAIAMPAMAQTKSTVPQAVPLPGIGSFDPRTPVQGGEAPWTSIGLVQTQAGGRCTGTLIAPDLVLTAAHCLISPRTGDFVAPGMIRFMLGYDRGRFRARGTATAYRTGAGYDPARRGPGREDWAILLLGARMPGVALPLLEGAAAPRTPLLLGGYQQDRPEVIMADTGCRLLDTRDGLLLHDCAGTRGASGAPLLVRQGSGWAVAGIASRVAPDMALGQAVSVEMVRHAVR